MSAASSIVYGMIEAFLFSPRRLPRSAFFLTYKPDQEDINFIEMVVINPAAAHLQK